MFEHVVPQLGLRLATITNRVGIACAIALASVAVPQLALFSVMSGETYFKTGSLPWAGFLTSAVIATALLYSAAETLERRDF